MELLLLVLINVFFATYSIIDGMKEAFCKNFDESSKKKVNFKFKRLFNIQRIFVYLIISTLMLKIFGIYFIPFAIGPLLMFSYYQKMFFNFTYNKINPLNTNLEIDMRKKLSFVSGVILQVVAYIIIFF